MLSRGPSVESAIIPSLTAGRHFMNALTKSEKPELDFCFHIKKSGGPGIAQSVFGVRVPVESGIFSSSPRPGRLGGPPNILPNGYRDHFPRG
jgi:hypothetical protein